MSPLGDTVQSNTYTAPDATGVSTCTSIRDDGCTVKKLVNGSGKTIMIESRLPNVHGVWEHKIWHMTSCATPHTTIPQPTESPRTVPPLDSHVRLPARPQTQSIEGCLPGASVNCHAHVPATPNTNYGQNALRDIKEKNENYITSMRRGYRQTIFPLSRAPRDVQMCGEGHRDNAIIFDSSDDETDTTLAPPNSGSDMEGHLDSGQDSYANPHAPPNSGLGMEGHLESGQDSYANPPASGWQLSCFTNPYHQWKLCHSAVAVFGLCLCKFQIRC